MIFGKNRERGSMAFTGIIGVGVIALATMFAQQSSQQTKQKVDESRNSRGREAASIGADNTLARFKGLISERKMGVEKYIPAVFAENYYELVEWKLMERSASESYSFPKKKSGAVQVTYQKMDTARIAQIMNGARVAGTGDSYKIDVIKPNFLMDESKPGYRKVVTSVDINVTGTSSTDGAGLAKTSKVSARITLPVPKPYDVKLRYRETGSSAAPVDITAGTVLPSGNYEFFIFASGIVYDAQLFVNNIPQDPVGGFDPATGLISHGATNYMATDKQIGRGMKVDMQAEEPPPPATAPASAGGDWAPDSFSQSTCSFVEGGGSGGAGGGATSPASLPVVPATTTITLKAIAYGPDREATTAAKTDDIQIKIQAPPAPPASSAPSSNGTGSGTQTLTQGDYANMCSADNACAWVGTDNGNGMELGRVAKFERPKKDISSYYTFKQGQDPGKWGIFKKKVCFNFANSTTFEFADADVVTYDVSNCKRQVLFKRTTCGCVTADTEIVMGDGKTTKRIDEIVESDLIWNPLLKKAFPIRRMTVGPEKIPMIKIQIAGREIKATGKHPFVTRTGIIPAFQLEEGQDILIEDGIFAKISAIESIPVAKGAEAPNVWNIELEAPDDDHSAHHIVANGITTGDLMIQMKLENGLIK